MLFTIGSARLPPACLPDCHTLDLPHFEPFTAVALWQMFELAATLWRNLGKELSLCAYVIRVLFLSLSLFQPVPYLCCHLRQPRKTCHASLPTGAQCICFLPSQATTTTAITRKWQAATIQNVIHTNQNNKNKNKLEERYQKRDESERPFERSSFVTLY